jgi:hypothetical protein
MTLAPGTKLGPYEIVAPLGASVDAIWTTIRAVAMETTIEETSIAT